MAFLRAAGRRLEYERIDGAGGPTLVFLHEGLGCVSQWRDFPQTLSRETGCPAVVYSRLGHGRSDRADRPRPVSFMHDEARGALPEILELLHIDEAILIGHSDGASIALIYAGEDGTKLRGLILEAPHVFVEDRCIASIARLRVEWGRTELRERLARHHADVDGMFHGWADVWLNPDFRQWNLSSFLPGVRVPVMVIQGEGDEYGTAAQVDAVCTEVSGPSERLMLADCGHSPHRDKPDETLAAMVRWIRGGP